jgi:K+-transporting ATPase KdpF subunit
VGTAIALYAGHDRPHGHCDDDSLLPDLNRVRRGVCASMSWELILAGVVATGILGYLVFALLNPERF